MAISWMPPLVLMEDFDGNWDSYLDAIYGHFCADFICEVPVHFNGVPVRLKRHPIEHDKEATFWHFISEGSVEAEREVNFRRCERIRWPRAMMDNVADPELKVWEEAIRNEVRTHIWCEEFEYLVVVANRNGFVLPWTAYHVGREHEKRKLFRRWQSNR